MAGRFCVGTMQPGVSPPGPRFNLNNWLTDDEGERLLSAIRQVINFTDGDLLPYVTHSLRMFVTSISAFRSSLKGPRAPNFDFNPKLDASCRLLTFCSSIFLYSDQTHKKVKRSFGKDSKEFQEIKRIFNDVYDKNLGYAFCYRLRNQLTHHQLDAIHLSWEQEARPRPSGILIPHSNVAVWVSRSELLATDGWSNLADRMADLPERVDIEPLMSDALDGVGEVARVGAHLISPSIETSLDRVESALRLVDNADNAYLFDVPPGAFVVQGVEFSIAHTEISSARVAMARAISQGNPRYWLGETK